jgi:predicted metal-dependent hydrolase
VPRRFDERLIPRVLESNHEWVQRAAKRVEMRREAAVEERSCALPGCISLPATGQEWAVQYRSTGSSRAMVLERPDGRLIVSGATGDDGASREALARWLRRVARNFLATRLREIAGEEGFVVKRVEVRSQRTRWASCSRNGTISLNVRLMCVPPELVRHIMLHELCHTVRMDHSKHFWALLERYDRDWREHRRLLRAAWREIPPWLIGS